MSDEVKMVKASEFFNKPATEKKSTIKPTGWDVKKDEKDGVYKFYNAAVDMFLEFDDINKFYGIEIVDIGSVNDDKRSAEVQLQSDEWKTINLDDVGIVKLCIQINGATRKKFEDEIE